MRSVLSENPEEGNEVPKVSEEDAKLHEELAGLERKHTRTFDPGMSAMVIAIAVVVILAVAIVPYASGVSGWQVVFGHPLAARVAGVAPRVFLTAAMIVGCLGSAISLLLRRYTFALVLSVLTDMTALSGVISIWSQQTTASHQPGQGPGIGMIVTLLAIIVLAFAWSGIVWQKPQDLIDHQANQ
jgi:hypothetical protein